MLELLSRFAAEDGPAIHVAPGGLFEINGWTITNSIFYGWITSLLVVVFLVWVSRKFTVKPKRGPIQLLELGIDFIYNQVLSVFNDKKTGRKYAPYFVTLFFFILLNTWLGLLPIVGEGFTIDENPVFRPFTGDWNGTFAMAAVTMIFVYAASIKEAGGFFKYLRHFFVGSPWNPLYFTVGLLEIFSDLTRVVSLSIRLFLNVAIGEMVIAVFAFLGGFAAPITALPFTLIELGVGALQSYIFVTLGMMYLAISVNASQSHSTDLAEPADLTDVNQPETIKREPANA